MIIERDGHNIYCEVYGEGDPLVFVHGWMMSSAVWKNQIDHFAKSHQVIVFDLTGYGQSDKPDITYNTDTWLADVDSVISHLNLTRPTYIGWSMGGSIGMEYSIKRPGILASLILVDCTPLLVAPPEVFPNATPPEMAEQLLGAINTDFSSGARGFVELMFPEDNVDDIKDELHAISQQTTGPIALESVMAAGTADLRPILADICVPTTLLHGEEDMVSRLEIGQYLAENIPNATLHTFPGKGHAPFLTDAENFNSKLAELLSK